jgi:hypothetical protein
MRNNRLNPVRAAVLLGAAALLAPVLAQAAPFYKLESAVTLPGAVSGWDYVTFEPGRSYLYLGRRKEGVTVYDAKAGKVVGSIDNSEGANSAKLVPEFDRGYTINEDGSSTVFQISTLKTLERIKLGEDADNAFYDPQSKQLLVMMGDSKQIAFVDAASGKLLGKLKMDSEKLESAVPDGAGSMLVAERDKNRVQRIDMKAHQVTATWATTGCTQPTGMDEDKDSGRLFIGCRGDKPVLAVMDSHSGKVVADLEIGRGNDGVVYDARAHKVYTSNGVDADLVIYDQEGPDQYKLEQAVGTRPQARTMALDPDSGKVYTITAEGVVDPARPVLRAVSPFYLNRYFPDSFTLLTYAPR